MLFSPGSSRSSSVTKSEEFSPESEGTVSCVKAANSRSLQTPTADEQATWRRRQLNAGRLVIRDSHFLIGKSIRSVPRLGDASESTLMRRHPYLHNSHTVSPTR